MHQESLSDWGYVLIFLLTGGIFLLLTLTISRIIRPSRPNEQKLSTYESGEQPQGTPWARFNIRFYILALIFLLFEVEVVFLFPWATVFTEKQLMTETGGRWGTFALVEMLIFVVILALGLAYAWAKGHLDWIGQQVRTENYKSPVPRELYDKINEQYASKK